MASGVGLNRLAELVASEMRGHRPMTASEIVRAIQRHAHVKTDARSVTYVLTDRNHFRRSRRRFFQRGARWELVEAGPADDPGAAGAPVPARPYRPTLSGAAAAELTFRDDNPPTNAIGRTA
jgi:hypothetical protein